MSSKPAEPRSIASQLVFLFTPAAAILLGCGLAILYSIVVRHAFEEDRTVLGDKLFAIRADLRRGNGAQALSDELKTLRSGEKTSYWVRIIDASGRVAAETPGMQHLLPTERFARGQSARKQEWGPEDYRNGGRLFSLVSSREEVRGQPYVIQLAQDRSEDERFMLEFGFLVGGVLVCGIFASVVIAVTVSKRGLQPLTAMTKSLRRVGPGRLHERVPPAEWPRELQPVAIAFDDMLDRLEGSFTRLSQFSADLAHELRTPLANIRGEAQVALTRDRAPAEYRETIESTIGECERLSGIVDNLLFVARVDAAREPIAPMRFDARAAVEKIASFYQMIADDRSEERRVGKEWRS